MMGNKDLTTNLSHAIEENKYLTANHDVLIKSNKHYEEKWQKIFYTLEFYKEFYYKYIDLITNKYIHNKPAFNRKLEKLGKLREKFNLDITESNPDQLIKGLKKIDEENGRLINISMLAGETNDDENSIPKILDRENIPTELTRDQSKIFLMNLAQYLYVNTNINKGVLSKNMIKILENDKKVRHIKSQSNPFDYIDKNLESSILEQDLETEFSKAYK